MDCFSIVVVTIIYCVVSGSSHRLGEIFAAFGCVGGRNLIFREDGFPWAFRDTGATVNTGICIDVVPGPFIHWFARNNAFHRADCGTAAIPQA
jgi:hypothetical protein